MLPIHIGNEMALLRDFVPGLEIADKLDEALDGWPASDLMDNFQCTSAMKWPSLDTLFLGLEIANMLGETLNG